MADPAARADVSVVVVVSGDEHELAASVRSLLVALDHAAGRGRRGTVRLRGQRLHGEVLLVARDVARLSAASPPADPRVRVVAAPGVGEGRARNVGVAAARGRYLLFTDAEVRVPADWVLATTAPLRAGHADLVGGAVRLADRLDRSWLSPDLAAAYLDVVPDPPVAGGPFSGVSMGASRAVLESVGFDEDLGTRARPYGGDVVFRRDVVGAGFREQPVAGVPVERHLGPRALSRRELIARARAHGRAAAYVDRHLRDVRPARPSVLVRLAGRWLRLAALGHGRGRAGERLRAHAAVGYHREMLRLVGAPYRQRPQSAAGDVAGGAGAPRAAVPVALVPRDSVPPTALPEGLAAVADGTPVRADEDHRGSVYQFWSAGRSRGGEARAATPTADALHGTAS
ncbi:glycosyltransferase family 2 protein [Cellulomonas hominis]|uniref:glycosyltransferase family 2 protein n=1 Tax=Cellulomonas hominis TaxID=156981 RepID=UPI001B9557E0|nr:glycosyltransferase [Cellulomonas hominis]VTR78132.1 hypothetical protein CHMI_02908 [Cellulomonas hominis]